MDNISPQFEIFRHFVRGESLTVCEALTLYHTTELRKVVSRLNKDFFKDGKQIFGTKIGDNKYKTYWLIDSAQIPMAI